MNRNNQERAPLRNSYVFKIMKIQKNQDQPILFIKQIEIQIFKKKDLLEAQELFMTNLLVMLTLLKFHKQ